MLLYIQFFPMKFMYYNSKLFENDNYCSHYFFLEPKDQGVSFHHFYLQTLPYLHAKGIEGLSTWLKNNHTILQSGCFIYK